MKVNFKEIKQASRVVVTMFCCTLDLFIFHILCVILWAVFNYFFTLNTFVTLREAFKINFPLYLEMVPKFTDLPHPYSYSNAVMLPKI